jgi:hypothetical protein
MDRREFLAGSLVAAVSPPITALATADVFRCFLPGDNLGPLKVSQRALKGQALKGQEAVKN